MLFFTLAWIDFMLKSAKSLSSTTVVSTMILFLYPHCSNMFLNSDANVIIRSTLKKISLNIHKLHSNRCANNLFQPRKKMIVFLLLSIEIIKKHESLSNEIKFKDVLKWITLYLFIIFINLKISANKKSKYL